MSKDPRKKLRRLAKELRASEYYGMAGQGAKLADAVLRFLKNEQITLVICDDKNDTTTTAHPSPHFARLEMISCMLDGGASSFRQREHGHEFLGLVAAGKFKAAISAWSDEAIEQGTYGSFYSTHQGKVERNYTVAELKERANIALEDAERCGHAQTFTPLRERVSTALANGPKTVMEIAINIYGGEEKPYRTPKNTDRAPRVKCADSSGYGRVLHMLWLMGKAGTVERLKAGLYQLKEKTT